MSIDTYGLDLHLGQLPGYRVFSICSSLSLFNLLKWLYQFLQLLGGGNPDDVTVVDLRAEPGSWRLLCPSPVLGIDSPPIVSTVRAVLRTQP